MAKKKSAKTSPTSPQPIRKAAVKKVATAKSPSPAANKKVAKKKVKPTSGSHTVDNPPKSISPAVVCWSPGPPTPDRPYLVERILTREEVDAEYFARQVELDARIAHAKAVLAKWQPELLKSSQYGEITGLSVRFRTKFGEVVSPLQVVIAVNVAFKYALSDLPGRQCIPFPRMVEDVPVKVLEGKFELLSSAISHPANPLPFDQAMQGGVPVAPKGSPQAFGTLGVILQETTGLLVGLTNAHVISGGLAVQLGPIDPATGQDTVREVGNVSPSRSFKGEVGSTVLRSVDCALVTLASGLIPSPTPWEIRGFTGEAREMFLAKRPIRSSDRSLEVWKFGAASGALLIGKLHDLDVELIRIGGQNFVHTFSVRHRDGNNTFVIPGDSGSVLGFKTKVATPVGTKKAFVLFGLLFAQLDGDSSVAYACQIRDVVQPLKLDVDPDRFAPDWETNPSLV